MKPATTPTGNFGEELATRHLKQKGYQVLKRNWKSKVGEVDILARDGDAIVVVEVKTKSNPAFGHPAEMVGYYKQRQLLRLAKLVEKLYPKSGIRIDVVAIDLSVEPSKIEHIENAVLAEG